MEDLVIFWGLISIVLMILTPIVSFIVKLAWARKLNMTLKEFRMYEKELEEAGL